MQDPCSLEQWYVCVLLDVPRFIRPTQKSKRQAEKVLMTVIAIETGVNQCLKKT